MTADLRVLTLWQPFATLWADPTLPKTIESGPRPWPSTIPLPAWVLIHAAARRPDFATMKRLIADVPETWNAYYAAGYVSGDGDTDNLPLGAVIGAVHVTHCLPIADDLTADRASLIALGDSLYEQGAPTVTTSIVGDWCSASLNSKTEDLPYGIYTSGRYGYLTDRTVLFPEPIPYRNGQGFRRATPELAAQVAPHIEAIQ